MYSCVCVCVYVCVCVCVCACACVGVGVGVCGGVGVVVGVGRLFSPAPTRWLPNLCQLLLDVMRGMFGPLDARPAVL